MATKWVILAAILSLALGVVLGDDKKKPDEKGQEQTTPKTECCDLSKALPLAVTEPPKDCIEKGNKQNPKEESEICKAECILGSLKLLNEDKSIKLQEAKKAVLDGAHADAKKVIEEAMDKCLKNYSNDKSNSCKSAKEVSVCVISAVKLNCPKTLWLNTKPECKS